MKLYSDGFYTIVAEGRDDAVKLLLKQEFVEKECIDELQEVDPDKKKMWFPIDELPEQYHDEEKYPKENKYGEYVGVKITLREAMQYCKDKPPFVIGVSSELV